MDKGYALNVAARDAYLPGGFKQLKEFL